MTKTILSPDWIIGFVDRSASFFVHLEPKETSRHGARLRPEFRIVQSKRDRALLNAVRSFFGRGHIRQNSSDQYEYRVRELPDLRVIINFFLARPLKSSKQREVVVMGRILDIMLKKRELSQSEFHSIVRWAKPLMQPVKRGERR